MIGSTTYLQIENLYRELGLSERVVRVNDEGFKEKLVALIIESISKGGSIKKKQAQVRRKLFEGINAFHRVLQEWFNVLL